jgi:CubicO group peptidase (beta-lactamase class C family)
MAKIAGFCDAQFGTIPDILSDAIDSGEDLGLSFAITINGKFVADMWGGWADIEKTTPWTENTLTNVWSTTKTMTALAALVLVDRGALDLDAPVSLYWPEFASNGKQDIEVRHLLGHTSGLSGWDQPVVVEDLYDWQGSTAKLAAQAPWWEPGTTSGYHAISQGHLVGEVIRRITGRKLGQFFAEEIAAPLHADFHIGLAPEHDDRVSNVVAPPPRPPADTPAIPGGVAMKTVTGPMVAAASAWTPEWRRADIGAANGHGNARSIARIQSVVANGGSFDGVRLLSPATIARIFEEQSNGIDLLIGVPIRFGMGYALPNETWSYLPPEGICFWGGWGGSMVVADVDRRMTIVYAMNKMSNCVVGNDTAERLMKAVYAAADAPYPSPQRAQA